MATKFLVQKITTQNKAIRILKKVVGKTNSVVHMDNVLRISGVRKIALYK